MNDEREATFVRALCTIKKLDREGVVNRENVAGHVNFLTAINQLDYDAVRTLFSQYRAYMFEFPYRLELEPFLLAIQTGDAAMLRLLFELIPIDLQGKDRLVVYAAT